MFASGCIMSWQNIFSAILLSYCHFFQEIRTIGGRWQQWPGRSDCTVSSQLFAKMYFETLQFPLQEQRSSSSLNCQARARAHWLMLSSYSLGQIRTLLEMGVIGGLVITLLELSSFKLETNVIPLAMLLRAICRGKKMGHRRNLISLVITF